MRTFEHEIPNDGSYAGSFCVHCGVDSSDAAGECPARLRVEVDRLTEVLREIAFFSTAMPAAWNDEESWYSRQLHDCIGTAARALHVTASTTTATPTRTTATPTRTTATPTRTATTTDTDADTDTDARSDAKSPYVTMTVTTTKTSAIVSAPECESTAVQRSGTPTLTATDCDDDDDGDGDDPYWRVTLNDDGSWVWSGDPLLRVFDAAEDAMEAANEHSAVEWWEEDAGYWLARTTDVDAAICLGCGGSYYVGDFCAKCDDGERL